MNQPSSTDTSFSSSSRPSAETISRRAYELWEQEGRPEGSDLRHWLQAEQELAGRSETSPPTTDSNGTNGSDSAREQASDSRPLQGTRAGAAASRDSKRASRTPFSAEKSAATATAAKPEVATAGRRRG